MKKIVLPLLAIIGTLSFGIVSNSNLEKASATGEQIIEDGRYFIINDSNTYGFRSSGGSTINNVEAYDTLSMPFTFTHLGDNTYTISYVLNNITYYLSRKASSSGDIYCITSPTAEQKTWTITSNGDYYRLSTTMNDVRYLDYYEYGAGRYYEVKKINLMTENNHPDIRLVSVESNTSSLVNKISDIPCNNPTEIERYEAWSNAKEEFEKINSTPIINFLRTAEADKNADQSSIDWALSKYDYVRNKYGYTDEDNFLNREDVDYHIFDIIFYPTNNSEMNIVIIISIVSVISILAFLLVKKKHQ